MSTLTKTVMTNRITLTRAPALSPCPPVPLLAERRKRLKDKLVCEWAIFAEQIPNSSILFIVLILSTFLWTRAAGSVGLWERWRWAWAYGERAALAALSLKFCASMLFWGVSWPAEIWLIG